MLTCEGGVFSWGSNKHGQLGRKSATEVDGTPARLVWFFWGKMCKKIIHVNQTVRIKCSSILSLLKVYYFNNAKVIMALFLKIDTYHDLWVVYMINFFRIIELMGTVVSQISAGSRWEKNIYIYFLHMPIQKGVCHLLHFMHKGAVLPHRKRYSVTFWSRGVFWGAESESGRIFLIPPPWGRIQGGGGGWG